MKDKKLTPVLAVYTVIFYAVWAAVTLLLSGRISDAVSPVTADVIKDVLLKTVIWLIPAAVLIRRHETSLNVPVKVMLDVRRGWGVFLPVFVLFTVYITLSAWRSAGKLAIAEDFSPVRIITYLFVGVCEEAVFRGWLLNAAAKSSGNDEPPYAAIAVNALMFLVIHFPIWLKDGIFLTNITSGSFVVILLLSAVFSCTFLKSRSIIIPALLHAWWDLLLTSLAR